jgi:hypothetical protein
MYHGVGPIKVIYFRKINRPAEIIRELVREKIAVSM